MPAARWTETAMDLSTALDEVRRYLGIDEVCRETGLAQATVEDSLLRPVIEDELNPRGAICRPAARVGGALNPIPLWTREQVAEYQRRVELRRLAYKERAQARTELPMLTAAEAEDRGLASLERIAAEVPAPPGGTRGRAENTLRRFARDYRDSFPPEVAIAPSSPFGPPLGYRNRAEVIEWVLDHERGHGVPEHPVAG